MSDEIGILRDGMLSVLHEFPVRDITKALFVYLRKPTSRDIPTPGDLMSILRPEPVFDSHVYASLKRKSSEGGYLYGSELAYVRAYEDHALHKAAVKKAVDANAATTANAG